MKQWTLLVLFFMSIFSVQSLTAEAGEWFEQWKKIKEDYEDKVESAPPREAFLSIIKRARISPSLKKLDRFYKELTKSEGKEFRQNFKKFSKAYKGFKKKKDARLNFIEDARLTGSVSRTEKQAAKELQKQTDELEEEILDFLTDIRGDKLSSFEIEFDLITCDDETPVLLEPDGIFTVKFQLSDEAMKKYERTIRKKAVKELEKIRRKLENRLIELDQQFLAELLETITEEKIQSEGEAHKATAEEEWEAAKQEAETEVRKAIQKVWLKIRRDRVRYRKYQLNVITSVGKKLMSLVTSISRLVASNGADVTAYISLAKTTVSLALEIKGLLESPETVSERLAKDIAAYNELHEELRTNPDVVKQALLAKQETSIREEILTLKNKTAGLSVKASDLGKKIDELIEAKNNMKSIEDISDLETFNAKIIAAEEKISSLNSKHDELIERLQAAEEVIKDSEDAFDDQEPSQLLVAKEKLEDALSKIKTIKSVGEKMYDIAETLGVF